MPKLGFVKQKLYTPSKTILHEKLRRQMFARTAEMVITYRFVVFCFLVTIGSLTVVAQTDAILDWHELSGTCYGFARTDAALNYTSAETSCIDNGAELANTPGVDVHTFLVQFMIEGTDYWTGLQYNASIPGYVWSDGQSPPAGLWLPNEPNFSGFKVRYTRHVQGEVQKEHLLADKYDYYTMSYICQRDAVNIGTTGKGEEATNSEAGHYVTIDTVDTNSRLRCATLCLRDLDCGLMGYVDSSSQCTLLRWSENTTSLPIDRDFRFYKIERTCEIYFN